MSRYNWPLAPPGQEGEGDDPAGRGRFIARRRNGFDIEGALRVSRAPAQPVRRPGAAPGPFAPANGRQHLWQALGPVSLLGGQAEGNPRVSGRVNALCVHDGGQRMYAASANGGVWYSKDGGANWVSVAGLASTNTVGILRPAQRNACGALYVEFGPAEGDDLVFLGTGEITHPMTGEPGNSEGGIGILVADKPMKSVAPDPWVREAPNLVNNGVYRAGFATTQQDYEQAFHALFETLDALEATLSKQRYLVGHALTEADWRLFTTLIRFDAVYYSHFKCNLRRIVDYTNLSNYLRELYQVPGVAETVSIPEIKRHYYGSHRGVNPTGIVPVGPALDFNAPHDRARLK